MEGTYDQAHAESSRVHRADIRHRNLRIDLNWLCNHWRAHFEQSGNISASLRDRPGAGQSRADSSRHDYGRSVAGLGYTRPEDPKPKTWSPDRNVDVHPLRYTLSELWRALLLRSI